MKMKPENELALVIAYYISKFDRTGIKNLGYTTFNMAYRDIEKKIGVKATSLKNRRDEFDPIHNNKRVGWYQRPMSISRIKIVEQLSTISEPTLREIVKDVISGDRDISKAILEKLKNMTEEDRRKTKSHKFILRGPTGRKAEESFIVQFQEGKTPFNGTLKDCRDLGCGFDFSVQNNGNEKFVEVKGLDGYTGGVVFTDKEWRISEQKENEYFLAIVSGISGVLKFDYICNPFRELRPKRTISTNIVVNWLVSSNQISKHN